MTTVHSSVYERACKACLSMATCPEITGIEEVYIRVKVKYSKSLRELSATTSKSSLSFVTWHFTINLAPVFSMINSTAILEAKALYACSATAMIGSPARLIRRIYRE